VISNDAPVAEDMSLYRRLHPSEIVWDDNDECLRPTSGAFEDREMSIHLDDVLKDEGREPVSVLQGKQMYSLVSLTAGFVQHEEQEVRRTPIPEDASHGEVCGNKPKGRRRRFARAAEFVELREDALNPNELAKMRAATGATGP
jgi:hypothetical protein